MGLRNTLHVLVTVVAVTLAFIGGYMVACRLQQRSRYLSAKEFLRHLGIVPVGQLRAGTYRIPLGPGHNPVTLMITAGSRSGVVSKIVLGDTGVYFQYNVRSRRYGVPSASLGTGKNGGMWIDLGLKGRFSIKTGPRRGPPLYRLHGSWVPLGKLRFVGSTTECQYRGRRYFFDRVAGDWEPAPTGKPPHP